jgi:hypothetical protein
MLSLDQSQLATWKREHKYLKTQYDFALVLSAPPILGLHIPAIPPRSERGRAVCDITM